MNRTSTISCIITILKYAQGDSIKITLGGFTVNAGDCVGITFKDISLDSCEGQ